MILKESVVTTKGEKCAMFKQDCPTENLGLPHLDYLLLLIDRQRLTKASFLSIRNCLKRSLDDEIKHVRELLLSTIKSHSEESTEHFQINWKRQLSKIQRRVKEDPVFLGIIPCSLWNQTKGLQYSYLYYKQFLDLVLEDLVQVKSVIRRTLPRFLAKTDRALSNFEAALNCDWWAISVKYVQLEYYLRNLQRIWTFYQTSLPLRTSDFLSHRIKDVLLQTSNDFLKLLLRLGSEQQSADSLKYLEILKFEKPPLSENKGKGIFE